MQLRALCSVSLLLLATSGCAPDVFALRTDRSAFDARGVETIRLTSANGAIRAERKEALERIELEVELKAGGETKEQAEERLAATRLRTSMEQGELSAWAEFPEPRRGGDSATFTVHSPQPVALISHTSNGAIHVAGLERNVDVETSNGRIEIRGLHNDVSARTSNGAVEIAGALGKVIATSSNGAIDVELADAARGGFELTTSNGAVSISAPSALGGEVSLETSNGSVDVSSASGERLEKGSITSRRFRLGEGSGQSFVRTSNGAIRCTLR